MSIELTTRVYMTSKDAYEIADKLKALEEAPLKSLWGKDLTVKTWECNAAPTMIVNVKFVLDQER